MIDRAIAERNYPLFQGVGGPLSILTEFNVPHRARFKGPGRPPTAGRQILTANHPGRVKTFSSPKNCTQPSVIHFDATVCAYFAVSSQESIRAQPRATQNDLNGHTARTTVHAPQARIAARSGLIPTMFITRVRL